MKDQELHDLAIQAEFLQASTANWWNPQLDAILRAAVAEGWPYSGGTLHKRPGWKTAFSDEFASWVLNFRHSSERVWRKETKHIDGSRGPAYVYRNAEGEARTSTDVNDVFDKGYYNGLRCAEVAALTRAIRLGFLARPEQVPCALCGKLVFDDEKHGSHFCLDCWAGGIAPQMGKNAILGYARELAELTGTVPTLGLALPEDFDSLDLETKVKVVRLRKRQPTIERIREVYGSWFAVLIKSGVLPDGTQRMSRGIRSIAKDGHVCHSLPEKVICDFLAERGIEHSREPGYPRSNMRADFKVGQVYIEYFGLTGNPDYDAKTEKKREIAREAGIPLVELFPGDLADWPTTRVRLLRAVAELEPSVALVVERRDSAGNDI